MTDGAPIPPVASLRGVSLRYGARHALDAVTLNVRPQCMVGLIGPDGVGKSSVLALIAGARRIQTGTVHVLGGDMADRLHRGAVGPRIAYMPQGLGKNLYPTCRSPKTSASSAASSGRTVPNASVASAISPGAPASRRSSIVQPESCRAA